MCASASGPPTSGSSPFSILPGVFTQMPQSVLPRPFSTWNAAAAEPHMNPSGNVTSEGPEPRGARVSPSLQEAITASARSVAPAARKGASGFAVGADTVLPQGLRAVEARVGEREQL